MKALVVGGTGPTGPHVIEGLVRRGFDVTILHSGKHEVDFAVPVEHLHGDVHFLGPLEKILEHRTFDLVVGMYGRLRHLAEVVRTRTGRFIAIGGMPYKAFVDGDKGLQGVPVPVREDAPLFRDRQSNKFTYLMTESEDKVMGYHRAGDYAATILRFPIIYGPRQIAPREWSIIRRILDGRRRIILPDGGLKLERRGFAENAAHAVLLAVDKGRESAGEIYNVGDDTIWSLKDWVNAIARILECNLDLISIPFSAARPSRPYAGRGFHWVPDTEKIRGQLGYTDLVSPADGLRRTVLYYLENRPEPGGEIERALGDPFDYAAEDKLIVAFEESMKALRESFPTSYRFRHAYAHPQNEEPRGST